MKQANDFIKLHDAETNLPMGVAVRNIATFESRDHFIDGKAVKKTLIYFKSPIAFGDDSYTSMFVNENVERIMDLIYEGDSLTDVLQRMIDTIVSLLKKTK